LIGVALTLAAALTSCRATPAVRYVSADSIEAGITAAPTSTRRAMVLDPGPLGELYTPLGRRLGLIHIRDESDWARLCRAVSDPGPMPAFDRGSVVALVTRTGLPIDGQWPITIEHVRLCGGAGMICGSFHGGSYLADGATYAEIAFVETLRDVLIVDVNGVRYYPEGNSE
jgi:hypothetical protein